MCRSSLHWMLIIWPCKTRRNLHTDISLIKWNCFCCLNNCNSCYSGYRVSTTSSQGLARSPTLYDPLGAREYEIHGFYRKPHSKPLDQIVSWVSRDVQSIFRIKRWVFEYCEHNLPKFALFFWVSWVFEFDFRTYI